MNKWFQEVHNDLHENTKHILQLIDGKGVRVRGKGCAPYQK